MSMHGYDASFYDYGFSYPAISSSLYGNSLSPMAAAIDYDEDVFVRRRPPARQRSPSKNPSSPPKHRHDGTSPLPLGMDWSLPPRIWDGRNSVWPHDSPKGWSYCVTVPSWTIQPSASGSDTVFFRVQVGIQSPEGITTTRGVLRRFNEFLKLYSELKKEFPKKNLPPTPPRRFMKMRSKTLLEERRCALEDWMEKLLSDIDMSRTALVAIFLELEAAARASFDELTQNEPDSNPHLSLLHDHDSSLEHPANAEDLQGDLAAVQLNRVLNAIQERLGTTETDMEELVARLLKELDVVTEQAEILKKQNDEMELKSKLEVKLLIKVKSLKKLNSEMKQELSKCLEEKVELEKEKQIWEVENTSKVKLLHEFEVLRKQLQECSVSFVVDAEDKTIMDTETSDNQIDHLLVEAQVLAQGAETANQDDNGDGSTIRDDDLRMILANIFAENAKLRKQVNSVIRHALSTSGDTLKDDVEDDDAPVKTTLGK